MSSFITNSLIRPIAQWYSEINSATLTGAIDVLVVEQEDGTFLSSPFHVRFGKMGVLKAREKIVDIEINDEPVDIHMKLDDHGAAFFVEDVSESEDEEVPPELATSPIPSQSYMDQAALLAGAGTEKNNNSVNRSLMDEFNAIEKKAEEEAAAEVEEKDLKETDAGAAAMPESASSTSLKGKLNRKKRKRRNKGHARTGSKSSLKEVALANASSSESSESAAAAANNNPKFEDKEIFDMEDNDGDCDDDESPVVASGQTQDSSVVSSTPIRTETTAAAAAMSAGLPIVPASGTATTSTAGTTPTASSVLSLGEHSLVQSRLGHESIDEILEHQSKMNMMVQEQEEAAGGPPSVEYFSEPEMISPRGSRPSTPVLSDTEYETKRSDLKKKTTGAAVAAAAAAAAAAGGEQSWEWGKLPQPTGDSGSDTVDSEKSKDVEANKESAESEDAGMKRRWTFSSLWRSGGSSAGSAAGQNKKKDGPGKYLDELKDDEEMMAIYVGSVGKRNSIHQQGPGSGSPYDDDDAESGNGPSLPMSPHSVDGAIGGRRLMPPGVSGPRIYDSSDDEQRSSFTKGIYPGEVMFSLCGGLDNQEKEFSPLMFEQSLLSFDDYVHRLTESPHDFFNHPDLVVRMGDQYYKWEDACPIVMSAVLFGRCLPDNVLKAYLEPKATSSSPNSKTAPGRSSWWPFGGSRKPADASVEEGAAAASASQPDGAAPASATLAAVTVNEVSAAESLSEPKVESAVIETKSATPATSDGGVEFELGAPTTQEGVESTSTTRKRFDTTGSTTGSEEEREQDLKIKINSGSGEGEATSGKERKYKKTLRLTTEAIKKLNLKPGSNEAQFSVTTAFQGTSRCNCHIYWWRASDKIVVSDIDGTITKSDVLGHVMPIIGRDWAQSGVASLFTKIVANNYRIVYLSARAIGQASITKDYLATVKQGDVNLPDGPLFLNPTSLVNAFHREVIEKKPEKFKIACLRDIQKLFPANPLYAGYGNRVNDVFAYRTVGIPISRIFTINSKGELRHELTQTFQTSYDCQSSIVDHVFPPLSGATVQNSPSTHQEFSSFAYWREPILDIKLDKAMEEAASGLHATALTPAASAPAMAEVVVAAVDKEKKASTPPKEASPSPPSNVTK